LFKKKQKIFSATDEELVRMLSGSKPEAEEAFNEIYSRYASNVHAYCQKILGSYELAEDIFQDTFVRFFQNIKEDSPATNIIGFLITIARNLCLNYKKSIREVVDINDINYSFDFGSNYEKDELLGLITQALELLDFEYREAVIMRDYNGFSYEEIAELCNISMSNAKSRIFRGRKKIREVLSPYLNDIKKNF